MLHPQLDPDTPRELLERIYAELTDLIQQGIIRAAVEATYPLDEYPAAPAHAQRTGRNDKVPFAPANGAP